MLIWLLALARCGSAQEIPTLKTQTNLVVVPTLVSTKGGKNVFALKSSDFVVEDNGVPQAALLDEDTDLQPLSVVVAVQTGGSAYAEFEKMRGFDAMLTAMLGSSPHEVAIVGFDSGQTMLREFTPDAEDAVRSLKDLQPGDGGAAILDAVSYSVHLLEQRPQQNRRILLLVSETRDHGSRNVKIHDLVRQLGESNTTVYSVAFSPAATEAIDDVKDGANSDSPPNFLAGLVLLVQAMRKNVAHSVAQMSGGEYLRFTTRHGFDRQLGQLANQAHNQYMLSFDPVDPASGLHSIRVRLPDYPGLVVRARESYWSGQASDPKP